MVMSVEKGVNLLRESHGIVENFRGERDFHILPQELPGVICGKLHNSIYSYQLGC